MRALNCPCTVYCSRLLRPLKYSSSPHFSRPRTRTRHVPLNAAVSKSNPSPAPAPRGSPSHRSPPPAPPPHVMPSAIAHGCGHRWIGRDAHASGGGRPAGRQSTPLGGPAPKKRGAAATSNSPSTSPGLEASRGVGCASVGRARRAGRAAPSQLGLRVARTSSSPPPGPAPPATPSTARGIEGARKAASFGGKSKEFRTSCERSDAHDSATEPVLSVSLHSPASSPPLVGLSMDSAMGSCAPPSAGAPLPRRRPRR
mmetsp:Transcript_17659/g.57122  ORF Transcript_17659/g.57122 Transcript_17659/m.57122 type:complete len:256 (+) Transcript_17659:480-1247(+)